MNVVRCFRRSSLALLALGALSLLAPPPGAMAQVAQEMARKRAIEVRLGDRAREARQVVVRLRSRLRLGLSFRGNQESDVEARGARVESVMEDSPAQAAGVREGDIITHVNGRSLLDPLPGELDEVLDPHGSLPVQRILALARAMEPGEEVELRYLRDGSAASVTFDAGDMESPPMTIREWDGARHPGILRLDPENRRRWEFEFPEGGEGVRGLFLRGPEGGGGVWSLMGGHRFMSVELAELNPELGAYFSTDRGVLVLRVEEDSGLGLRAGDVIRAIDGREVEHRSDVRRILASYEEGEPVSFTVLRHGEETRVQGRAE